MKNISRAFYQWKGLCYSCSFNSVSEYSSSNVHLNLLIITFFSFLQVLIQSMLVVAITRLIKTQRANKFISNVLSLRTNKITLSNFQTLRTRKKRKKENSCFNNLKKTWKRYSAMLRMSYDLDENFY